METQISDVFTINRFSSGRRISLYNQLEQEAQGRGQVAIAAYVQRARIHDVMTRRLDDMWAAPSRRTLYSPEVSALDPQLDTCLSQFYTIATAHIADLSEDAPLHDRVSEMLTATFPAGVKAITNLPFIDQAAAVENIISLLQGQFATVVTELALTRKVAHLVELSAAYREAIDRATGPLTFDVVREARKRGHAYLLELVGMIIGTYHDSDNPDHVEARTAFMTPIIDHNETVRTLRRRRRNQDQDELDIETDTDAAAAADTDVPVDYEAESDTATEADTEADAAADAELPS